MPSSDPLRRLSLAIGAGGVIALAAISPVFAGSTTSGSAGDTSSCDAVVVQYPVAALMAEVECDEDDLVAGYTDNEDEQAEAEDQAGEDETADDQGDDQQGEDTSSAKPHKSHHSSDATENENENEDEDASDNEDDADHQSGGDESDDSSDDSSDDGDGGSDDSNDD